MEIYIDVIFFENTVLNSILLTATVISLKSKICFKKILLVSVIGSACSIIEYFITWNYGTLYIFKFFLSACMIYMIFIPKKIKNFIKQLLMFYIISFSFGGITYMLLFEINPSNLVIEANHFIGLYPIKVALVAGICGMILVVIATKLFKKNFIEKNIIYKIEIGYLNKKVELNVLLDSGNLLKDPITNESVIIIEKSALKSLLDLDILKNINNIINGKWIGETNSDVYKNNIRLIPFSSLGNDNGVLFGFKTDYVILYGEDIKIRKNVIVGVYNGKLTRTNLYSGLIGLNMLEEDTKNEFIKSA